MRVIEPLPRNHNRKKSRKRMTGVLMIGLLVIVGASFLLSQNYTRVRTILGLSNETDGMQSSHSEDSMKFFSAYDFQRLYDHTAYPNTNQLSELPVITGNLEADNRIRKIGESRGYKPQSVPAQPIIKVADIADDSGNLLQPLAYEGWLKLKELAAKDNIPLRAELGYRSIEKQREQFLQHFRAENIDANKVANGEVDDKVIAVLFAVAPPGYSRHQTGYAIDLSCEAPGVSAFDLSVCAQWLKDNNYNKAKQAGYIPSHVEKTGPPNVNTQTAEYVWVGTQAFY